MEKQYLHSIRSGLLVGVLALYVGLILSSQSRVAQGDVVDCSPNDDCCSLHDVASNREERLRALEVYVKTLRKTTGTTSHETYGLPHSKKKALSRTSRLKKKIRSKRKIKKTGFRGEKRKLIAVADRILKWPLHTRSFRISSRFGMRVLRGKKAFHKGIDLAAYKGTPVHASLEGKVIEARYLPGYGNSVLIAHRSRLKTRYAHLQEILVQEGQEVTLGQPIGTVGSTGHVLRSKFGSSGSHLHFEVYSNDKAVNPMHFLAKAG